MRNTLDHKGFAYMRNFPRFTLIGSFYFFAFGSYLAIKSDPVQYTDSPRYFKGYGSPETFWDEFVLHTGRNLQTFLFSLGDQIFADQGMAAFVSNFLVWFISASLLLFFIETNVKNLRAKNLYMIFAALIFTSNLIASWMIAVLSESMALSILIVALTIAILTVLKEVPIKIANRWLLISNIFIYKVIPVLLF
jgi:hypothetical protein